MAADRDLLREVRDRHAAGIEADRLNRTREQEDRHFYTGGDAQWPKGVPEERRNEGRPCETYNRLPQFVKQVTGEIRQNKPAIKVLPVDGQTDPELAKIYSAIIRHIESQSDAHRVYSRETEKAVIGGQGWWRIKADYCDDSSFEQDLLIESVPNPLAVVCDPDAKHPTRMDASWIIVTELVSRKKFEATYPKMPLTGFDAEDLKEWVQGDFIRIAEYWVKKQVGTQKLYALERIDSGQVENVTEDDLKDMAAQSGLAFTSVEDMVAGLPIRIKAEREVPKFKVCSILVSGAGELSDWQEWPGKYIPLVRVVGEEVEANDQVFRHGLIHHAKAPQVSYNFARNASMERYGTAAKVPWIATAEQIEPYKSFWETANRKNWPVLPYKHVPGVNPPQRLNPPAIDAAALQESQIAAEDMKATTGIYDSHLGAKSNETSGVAIRARDAQGDTATYVYIDNMEAAINATGRMLVDLIPHYYSDERIIRILGEDGEVEKFEAINQIMPDGAKWHDVTRGRYDVVVTTGPAYSTKRQEAADAMLKLADTPQVQALGMDMVVRALDLPMGDKLADRLKNALPPGIDEELDKERAEKGQGQQQQPSPEQMAMMAEQELKQAELQARQQEAQIKLQLQAQEAEQKMALERAKAEAALQQQREEAQMRAQAERERAEFEARLAAEKMEREFALAERKLEMEAQIAFRRADNDREVAMTKNRAGGALDK